MKKTICLAALVMSVLASSSVFASDNVLAPSLTVPQKLLPYGAVSRDGYFKGIRLAGKVKVVSNFADIKVQVVNSFPDLKVKRVDNFPDKIGEWKFVDNFPDFTIQYVNSFPDIKIQFDNNFPGVP
ncbi:MAG: hypothetical protein IJ056_10435 [Acidaminococcaceae bacterium]|nr:hypothetical protein [Acidaminococcaceae bacterium]MBQ9634948.1 hypothetical protein [Acidaminococcaceae bacterium]